MRRHRRASARLGSLVLAIGLVGGLGAAAIVTDVQAAARAEAVHRDDRVAMQASLAGLAKQYFLSAALDVNSVANGAHPLSATPGDAGDRVALSRWLASDPMFGYAAVVTDLAGNPIDVALGHGATALPNPNDPAFVPLRRSLLVDHQPGVSAVLDLAGRPVIAVAVPVYRGTSPAALLVGFADLRSWPLETYVQQLRSGRDQVGARYYLFDQNGRAISAPTAAEVGTTVPAVSALARGTQATRTVTRKLDGTQRITAMSPIGLSGMVAYSDQPTAAFYSELRRGHLSSVIMGMAALALALLLLVLLNHRRRQALQRLADEAIIDPLTGAATRRLLELRLETAYARSRRIGGGLGVIFVDLDHFKLINDTFGHNAGDHVLVQLADRLRSVIRDDDLLARLGGDEFVVVAEGLGDSLKLAELAARLAEVTREPMHVGEHEIVAAASVGAALVPPGGRRFEELVHAADASMYHAKANGLGYSVTVLGEQPGTVTEPSGRAASRT